MSRRLILAGFLVAASLVAGSSVANCTENALNVTGSGTAAKTTSSGTGPVDETALRYYASLKQTARVEAESRRLQRLNPDWRPPADLWTSRPGNADEGALWELFAADKLDDLRKAIDARRAKDPKWTPSTDLAQKLLRKEMRAKILAGKTSGRWIDAAAAADEGHFESETGDVELLWEISDAYARTKRPADALRILTSIIKARSDTRERIATIHRAIASLSMADTESLIALANIDASEGSDFAALRIDITRARISAYLHDEPVNQVASAEFARFKDYARAASDPSQPALVAWDALKRSDLREALEWFKLAIAQGGDATVAHGLAHTLRKLGQLREAEEIAYAWRGPSAANAILFIDILADQLTQPTPLPFESKRIARYAEVTLATGSGEGAQALAWFAYNSCQFNVAVEWFRRSVAWFPKEASVFGYAMTLRRLKRHQEFVEIVNRYDGLFPKVLTLLFPESRSQSSVPCDVASTARTVRVSEKASEFLDLQTIRSGPTVAGFARAGDKRLPGAASLRSLATNIPKPIEILADRGNDLPLVRRTDFPIAVAPENPLRYPTTDQAAMRTGAATGWREDGSFVKTVTARRVPGVAVMPYERFGITLLRSWNGSDQPSFAPDPASQAPLGTLWQIEQASQRLAASPSAANPADRVTAAALSDTGASPGASLPSRFHP